MPPLSNSKLLMILDQHDKDASRYIDGLASDHPGLQIIVKYGSIASDKDLEGVNFLLANSDFPSSSNKLEYVQLHSAGANRIHNLDYFKDGSVRFCTANGVHTAIPEHIFMTFLIHQHNFAELAEAQRQARWIAPQENLVQDCHRLRCGVLGYGSIGRQSARIAQALGMTVYAHTLRPRKTAEDRKDDGYVPEGLGDPEGSIPAKWTSGAEPSDIEAFVGNDLDLLIISLPGTPTTKGMIGAQAFQAMSKRKTFVCNVGRGAVVDTDALITALDDGLIRGCSLDVTDPEPLPDGHALWSKKNCIITPHICGSSINYTDRVLDILKINLGRLRDGRPLLNQVDTKLGY